MAKSWDYSDGEGVHLHLRVGLHAEEGEVPEEDGSCRAASGQ